MGFGATSHAEIKKCWQAIWLRRIGELLKYLELVPILSLFAPYRQAALRLTSPLIPWRILTGFLSFDGLVDHQRGPPFSGKVLTLFVMLIPLTHVDKYQYITILTLII